MRRIDVLLDARITSHMSDGMRAYTRELARRLPLVAPDLHFECFAGGDNFDLREQVGIPLEIARRRPRLVHFFSPYTPLVVPAPFVVTVQDLIDLHFPQFGKRKVQPYYAVFVRSVLARAQRVIAPGEQTRADLERFLGVEPARTRIVPLGVEEAFGERTEGEPPARPYFLYAGNHRPHKNLRTLFAAWQDLPAGSGIDLLLTGDDDLGTLLDAYRRGDAHIVFTGAVSRERLAMLYRCARAYVHPALLEGFGLPMLEAMWVGTPVIASETSIPTPLRPHALLFPPLDIDALRALLTRAVCEPADMARRGAAARTAAREWTWDRTARATVTVYRELLG